MTSEGSGRWSRVVLGAVVVPLALGLLASVAGAETVPECIARETQEGATSAEAIQACRADTPVSSSTTVATQLTPASSSKSSTGPAILAGVIGLAVGAVGGLLLGRRRSSGDPRPAAAAAAIPAPTAASATVDGVVVEHRRMLVAQLIDLRDRVPSDALRDEIGAKLRDVGVEEMPVGQGDVFDANLHRGVDTVPVADPAWDKRVATTERPGYVEAGRVLRLPEVTVYRYEQS